MDRVKLGFLAVVCIVLMASVAAAGEGWVFTSGGYGPYWGAGPYGWWSPWFYQQERIPYFALFPPVYYSYPVSRPYGYSPFAYLPDVRGPEAPLAAGPLTISNPYLAGTAANQAKPEPRTGGPLRIDNPYVLQSGVRGEKARAPRETEQSGADLVVAPAPAISHP